VAGDGDDVDGVEAFAQPREELEPNGVEGFAVDVGVTDVQAEVLAGLEQAMALGEDLVHGVVVLRPFGDVELADVAGVVAVIDVG
jgi:hypothetical protein